ncbi:hypothetical protein JR316_0011375 [Psilocybe cubensis]|uniref:Uncharacterized protein n=1 Tax=Psilocybe cubensis TaxID=181762 RepID=A0ACB8GK23_PSICU|nr:hypothetical protein JR316_0011375 [Psilocybe cubensis]KAH9475815.1 hypothetical protein JR316_0011375 [Psilocybe cubensis]
MARETARGLRGVESQMKNKTSYEYVEKITAPETWCWRNCPYDTPWIQTQYNLLGIEAPKKHSMSDYGMSSRLERDRHENFALLAFDDAYYRLAGNV